MSNACQDGRCFACVALPKIRANGFNHFRCVLAVPACCLLFNRCFCLWFCLGRCLGSCLWFLFHFFILARVDSSWCFALPSRTHCPATILYPRSCMVVACFRNLILRDSLRVIAGIRTQNSWQQSFHLLVPTVPLPCLPNQSTGCQWFHAQKSQR